MFVVKTVLVGLLIMIAVMVGAEEPVAPVAPAVSQPALKRFEFSQAKMGTTFRIVLYAPDEVAAKQGSDAAFARIEELNGIFSDYSAESELSKLCAAAGGPAVKVSPELFDILSASEKAAKQSDGAFDVTIGPLIKLWRLSRSQKTLPLPERIAAAKERSGIGLMKLDAANSSVRLEKAEMRLDLGGIAKGYAADEALIVLRGQGLTRALIAGGGDIRVGKAPPDCPPDQIGWKVAVAPLDPKEKSTEFLLLEDAAVSTSGDAEQHVEIGGVRYGHIVDPKTGLGMNCRRSVTVVAPNGTTSDWMDTAVYVLGAERGMKMIEEEFGISALFMERTGDTVRRVESTNWTKLPQVK